MSDSAVRFHFMNNFYEVPHTINDDKWHYVSASFRRENFQDTTTIYPQIDMVESPVFTTPFSTVYYEVAGGGYSVMIGQNFYGYIRQV